jgi:hypothetical protein
MAVNMRDFGTWQMNIYKVFRVMVDKQIVQSKKFQDQAERRHDKVMEFTKGIVKVMSKMNGWGERVGWQMGLGTEWKDQNVAKSMFRWSYNSPSIEILAKYDRSRSSKKDLVTSIRAELRMQHMKRKDLAVYSGSEDMTPEDSIQQTVTERCRLIRSRARRKNLFDIENEYTIYPIKEKR